jgi:hypothetical protein
VDDAVLDDAMTNRGLWLASAGCVLVLLAAVGAGAAEGDQLRATIDRSATVTAPGRDKNAVATASSPRVIVHVTGFQPATDGAVQAVVKAQKPDGTEQEIGRFGIFPQAGFKSDPAGAQRFSFPLPKDLAGGEPVQLKVDLVPARGKGEGAALDIGKAEIR